MLESRGSLGASVSEPVLTPHRRLRAVLRVADKPTVDTAIWYVGVVGGAMLPVAPAVALPAVVIAGIAYYLVRRRLCELRPGRRQYIDTIREVVSNVCSGLPRSVSSVSVWFPSGGHLIMAASARGQVPADGRTRITESDGCAIWEAYTTGKSVTEERVVLPGDGNPWVRREALPIPDVEDRISVAGVLTFELTKELSRSESNRVIQTLVDARPSLSMWLSMLVVAPDG